MLEDVLAQRLGHVAVEGAGLDHRAAFEKDRAPASAAEPDRGVDQRAENGIQVENGAADHLQHVGRRRLLVEGALQFLRPGLHLVEQPGVLDGDDAWSAKRRMSSTCLSENEPGCGRVTPITPTTDPLRMRGADRLPR